MNDDGIGRLEGISLRWARSLLIGTIALGCLAIVSGLLVAVGVWLAPDPRKPEAAPPPEPAKFTLSMAEKWSAGHPSYAPELEQAALAVDDPGQIPPPLATLFPSPAYAAADIWEDYCKVPSDYGCIQKEKRIKVPSASRTFAVLLRGVGEEDRDELTQVLVQQLPGIPLEKRLGMVAPILLSYAQLTSQNREAASAHEMKAKEAESSFAAELRSRRDWQRSFSLGGLWASLWGLGAVLSASMFVALLAIERHLRTLRSRPGSPL